MAEDDTAAAATARGLANEAPATAGDTPPQHVTTNTATPQPVSIHYNDICDHVVTTKVAGVVTDHIAALLTPVSAARTDSSQPVSPIVVVISQPQPPPQPTRSPAQSFRQLGLLLYQMQDYDGGIPGMQYLRLRPALAEDRKPNLAILNVADNALRRRRKGPVSFRITWPPEIVPTEVIELIVANLAKADIKSLRLVNRELEQKLAASVFYTTVVPFNTELYGMVDEDIMRITAQASELSLKAPSNTIDQKTDEGGSAQICASDAGTGILYKDAGHKIFQGFGKFIFRFGITFGFSEDHLARPPPKQELHNLESYHGSFVWPSGDYARFSRLAGLERVADETTRMRLAFATLVNVRELALSVDSGLGWLNGPDKSAHSQIHQRSMPLFATQRPRADRSATSFWYALAEAYTACRPLRPLGENNLAFASLSIDADKLPGLAQTQYGDAAMWPVMKKGKRARMPDGLHGKSGVAYLTPYFPDKEIWHAAVLRPQNLTQPQLEWLLETEWAQQAFLTSYVLAVVDNPGVFSQVTTLNLVKLSSGSLTTITQSAFWDTLTCLADVTIKVGADWRRIDRGEAGIAESFAIKPSNAVDLMSSLVQSRIKDKASVKKLHLGFTDGGEHAEGILARNQNILPAPLTATEYAAAMLPQMLLALPHVEDFTLSNCWVTPVVLEAFVRLHADMAMTKLCLHSVSLVSSPVHVPQPWPMTENPAWDQAVAEGAPAIAQPPLSVSGKWNYMRVQSALFLPRNLNMWDRVHLMDSWQALLERIAPGEPYFSFRPMQQPGDGANPCHKLQVIDLQSVGYACLPNVPLPHQRGDGLYHMNQWFRNKQELLAPVMLTTDDKLMGVIVQFIPEAEKQALIYAWGLQEGWADHDSSHAVKYDGARIGGTARFSGLISRMLATTV